MRRVRIELDEILLADLGLAGRAFQPECIVQLSLVLREELLQDRDRLVLLRQDTLRGDLPDVGWGQIDPVPEAVLQLRQFDPLGVHGSDHFSSFSCEVTIIQARGD